MSAQAEKDFLRFLPRCVACEEVLPPSNPNGLVGIVLEREDPRTGDHHRRVLGDFHLECTPDIAGGRPKPGMYYTVKEAEWPELLRQAKARTA